MQNFKFLIFFASFNFTTQANIHLIKKITINNNNRATFFLDETFTEKYLNENFFVKYANDIKLKEMDESIVNIPLISHIISIIWASGELYEIESMDHDYYHSLKIIKDMFKVMYPRVKWRGELIPKRLVKNNRNTDLQKTIAMLFSCGVDSTYTSVKHKDTNQLLITIFGNLELNLKKQDLIQDRRKKVIDFAKTYGHSNTFLSSNFATFINFDKLLNFFPNLPDWRFQTMEDLSWSGLCAPILFAKGIKDLYISSYAFWQLPQQSAGNIFIDSNIKFAGKNVILYTQDATRLDKVNYIKKMYENKIIDNFTLHVCRQPKVTNCCRCDKCLITIVAFLALGAHDLRQYGFNFNIEKLKYYFEKEFNHKELNALEHYYLTEAQALIKTRLKNGHSLTNFEKWFKNYDLESKYINKVKFKWQKLNKFLNKN